MKLVNKVLNFDGLLFNVFVKASVELVFDLQVEGVLGCGKLVVELLLLRLVLWLLVAPAPVVGFGVALLDCDRFEGWRVQADLRIFRGV